MGSSTIQSIVGQFLFPGFLDRLMVKKAREGQMTDTLNAEDRRDYLDQPVNDLHKIHGHFSAEAKRAPAPSPLARPGKCCWAPGRRRDCAHTPDARPQSSQRSALRFVQNQR